MFAPVMMLDQQPTDSIHPDHLEMKITVVNSKNIPCLKLVNLHEFWVAGSESGIYFFLSRQNFAVLPEWGFSGRLWAFPIFFRNSEFLKKYIFLSEKIIKLAVICPKIDKQLKGYGTPKAEHGDLFKKIK